MEVNKSKKSAVDQPRKESEIHFIDNQDHVKCELENKAHPFEGSEMEATVKVETYSESDSGDLWTNIVKSELVEFNNTNEAADPSHENHLPTNVLENILKIETETETITQISLSHQKYPLYNNATFSCSDSDADPESDPFAGIDCDQNFSQTPPSHNPNDSYSVTQVQLINATGVVSGNSNPSSSSGNSPLPKPNPVTPTVTEDQVFDRQKSYYFTLQCHLCLQTQSSESKLKIHLEICAASHKNRNRFCILCNKLFSFPRDYRRHALQLHGIESFKPSRYTLKCNLCPIVFVRKGSLLSHVAKYHATETDDPGVK